ncbi:MAG TPA: BrnA antitoxin family protein [Devosiaceae bacterium]|jgi:uncharacterized protein (DUF4415 family)|nr:BrnA antitoxin family protein [Devosiaceae bacterium]
MTASEKIVRYSRRPLTQEEKEHLEAVAKLPDEGIDFSDIPEAGDQFFDNAVRGPMFRPVKKQTTLRLDADLIEWFKRHSGEDGSSRGYQTRINRALREYVAAQEKARKAR